MITIENSVAGQECYFESVMSAYRYGIGASMTVGAHRSKTTFTSAQSSSAQMEFQEIRIQAGYKLDTQVVDLLEFFISLKY